jgi:hypothetical protein
MAFQVSPGVVTKEIDLSTIIPAVSTTLAGYCGVFEWGPADKIIRVDSVGNLLSLFGKPNNSNYKHWFTAANFLGYGNNLKLVRAIADDAKNAANSDASTTYLVKNKDDYDGDAIADTTTQWVARYPGAKGNSLKVAWHDGGFGATYDYIVTGVQVSLGQGDTVLNADADGQGLSGGLTSGNNFTFGGGITGAVAKIVDSAQPTGSLTNVTLAFNVVSGWTSGMTFSGGDTMCIDNTTGLTLSFANATVAATGGWGVSAGNYNPAGGTGGWFLANQFATKMPFTTQFAQDKSGSDTVYDGVNIAVIDEDGEFSGTKGTVLEIFDGLSKAANAIDHQGNNLYYKDYINENSKYIYWGNFPRSTTAFGLTEANQGVNETEFSSDGNLTAAALGWGANLTSSGGTFATLISGGSTSGWSKSMVGGTGESRTIRPTSGVSMGYALFSDTETVDVNLILGGPAGYTESVGLIDLVEARKDAVVFLSPDETECVSSSGVPREASTQVDNIITYRNGKLTRVGSSQGLNSSYGFMDSGWKYMYDQFNDVFRWVPFNGDVAGLVVRSDEATETWFSPAGFNRGKLRGVIKISLNPSKAQRDDLYQANVNPIVAFPGEGTILFGDKTLQSKPSAFDRINVRRLFIVLEKAISTAAKYQLFEQNDAFTRAQFKNMVEPFLRDVQSRRGVTDFKVVCDESNNTGEVVDRNEFIADIFIKPTRSINFITLNFIATRTGVSFDEVGI